MINSMTAIYSKSFDERSALVINHLIEILMQAGVKLSLYKPLHDFLYSLNIGLESQTITTFDGYHDLNPETRFLISVGGDGTFLNSINIIRDSGIPVVGINTGRLGFLANITGDDLRESIEKLLSGELPTDERILLHATVNGQPADDFSYSLNDVVISKNNAALMTVHTWSNGEFLNSYWADGLIVATPTGSSAYSLSVGGPIVSPEAQNFIISPIAAHNLNVRPLVIPDNVTLKLKAECRDNSGFILSLDSRHVKCRSDDEIEIKRADFKVKIIRSASFYATLRNKLMWGVDKRN